MRIVLMRGAHSLCAPSRSMTTSKSTSAVVELGDLVYREESLDRAISRLVSFLGRAMSFFSGEARWGTSPGCAVDILLIMSRDLCISEAGPPRPTHPARQY